MVTLNSDDPGLFSTTLTEEFLRAQETFNLTLDEITELALNALRASFLEPARKVQLIAEFEAEFERLRGEVVPV